MRLDRWLLSRRWSHWRSGWPVSRVPGQLDGQVLILATASLVAMLGLLGLVTDLGYSFAQRRAMQNAADAAAIAGAHIVSKPAALRLAGTVPASAQDEVNTIAQANRIGDTNTTVTNCEYVDDANQSLGSCSIPVPLTATGVRVTVQERHGTFFMQVIPGAPETLSTSAHATAHIQKLKNLPTDGPFLVCGVSTKLAGGGSMSILMKSGGNWVVNPAADGRTFEIHGPSVSTCDAQSSRFKGIADQTSNGPKTLPGWLNYTEGNVAGQVSADVTGINGCKAGQVVENCVVLLPVAVNQPAEVGNNKQLYTVVIAAFYVTQPKSNTHNGQLIVNYVVSGEGDYGWQPGYTGPIVIRLTD